MIFVPSNSLMMRRPVKTKTGALACHNSEYLNLRMWKWWLHHLAFSRIAALCKSAFILLNETCYTLCTSGSRGHGYPGYFCVPTSHRENQRNDVPHSRAGTQHWKEAEYRQVRLWRGKWTARSLKGKIISNLGSTLKSFINQWKG